MKHNVIFAEIDAIRHFIIDNIINSKVIFIEKNTVNTIFSAAITSGVGVRNQ